MDAIEDLLSESIADDINKITADNVKDGANLKPVGDKSSPDTQGVLGSTSGTALDAGGDKDVGPSGKKGHFPSQASSDTQGVLGTTSGAAMDAGGDTDVGGSKGDNPSDASADTQGVEGKTTGAALDAGGDKDVGKLKEDDEVETEDAIEEEVDLDEDWSFIDEETGEELSEEEVEEFAEWVADNYELDQDLEEMMLGSKAGTKQSKSHIMKKAISRQAGAGEDGNKKISLAGPGGKKITATKTNKTEPGKRFSVGEEFIVFDEDTGEEFEATLEEMIEAGWTEEELSEELTEENYADKADAMRKKERGANADAQSQRNAEKTAKANKTKMSSGNVRTKSTIGNRDKFKPNKELGAQIKAIHGAPDAAQARKSANIDRLKAIKAKVDAKKAQKEEFEMYEAEQPESVGGKSYEDANKQYRPEQEKDVMPKPHGAGNPMGSTTGAALDAGGDKDAAPAGKKGQYPSEASSDTQGVLGKTKGAALDAGGDKDVGKLKEEDELEEKLHGDQHKLDHNDNNKIDASDMKMVRKKGATAHLNKEEVSEEDYIELEDFLSIMEMTEEEVESLSEDDLEKMKAAYFKKGGKVTKGKTATAKGVEYGYQQGQTNNQMRSKGSKGILKGRSDGVKEEVDEDEGLTEDFKARAEVIFEAAVGEKVSMIREEMEAEYATKIEEETARLNEQVAQYVEEAVEEWLKENALEVRYSLRTEIAEGFMKGLKGLFQESYIEIPEDDASVVDELTEAVEEQRDTIATLQEELKESKQFILETRRKDVLASLTEDLTATQAIRLEKLAENLEAADVEEFKGKVEKLKEGYFDPTNEQPFIASLSEEVLTGEQFIAEDDASSVSQYAKFLSKTVLK